MGNKSKRGPRRVQKETPPQQLQQQQQIQINLGKVNEVLNRKLQEAQVNATNWEAVALDALEKNTQLEAVVASLEEQLSEYQDDEAEDSETESDVEE